MYVCARLRDVLSVMTYQVHYVNLTLFLLVSQSNVKISFLIFWVWERVGIWMMWFETSLEIDIYPETSKYDHVIFWVLNEGPSWLP